MRRTPLRFEFATENWPLRQPFRITGRTFASSTVVRVRLDDGRHVGHGEATGVFYRNDDARHIARVLEEARPSVERGFERDELQSLLPCGGARNALDCALWDLEARRAGRPVWALAGLEPPRPLVTTFTIGADTPAAMAELAASFAHARALKLKLVGDGLDATRVRAVREVHPDAWLGVDANQGFTRGTLDSILPALAAARVALVEQPLPAGLDHELDGLESPIPLAADESAQGLADLESLRGRFRVVNVKLDKCGGLTEGLAMARRARELGFDVMVGNMVGTSLSAAPAYLVGQLCSIVDLDGPAFLAVDRTPGVRYEDGRVHCDDAVWGEG